MARRRRRRYDEKPGRAGFLVVDKPQGWTSHDVVDAARHWLGTRRVGHLGTLDPLATGVLPLAIREATKLVPFLEGGRKGYRGSIRLGEDTDTLDAEGTILHRHAGPMPSEEELREAMAAFVGEIQQIPPMYSAVKHDGVPLHRLAREGKEVDRPPKTITIDRLTLVKYTPPIVEIEVDCSAGTYVRALASDLGARLGCGAHLAALHRTLSGPFVQEQAMRADTLAQEAERGVLEDRLIHPVNALGMPVLRLEAGEVERVIQGGELAGGRTPVPPGTKMAALEPNGELLAVMEMKPGRRIRPVRVLRSPGTKRSVAPSS
jgi:tRNA pseudouridine55 synthase